MAAEMKLPTVTLCVLCLACGLGLKAADKVADFYVVDVGHGDTAFVVSPSGEALMLDAGPSQAANRILAFMSQNGIKKVDYLVVSHFENDHMGAAAPVSEKAPILTWVDHGQSVVVDKDDLWWKQRRGPWARPGMGKQYDQSYERYRKAREKGKHVVVAPGDGVPIKGLDVRVVSSAGKVLSRPLKGAGAANPACAGVDKRAEDDAEDGQSVGVVVGFGKFRLAYLGDLTWNTANALFCPRNLVGTVDAYLVTHHAQSMAAKLGAYYHGLSCCSAAEVHGLRPRVSILSMGAAGHREGTPEAMQVVRKSPGMEDLWQTNKVTGGGEAGENSPDQFIANIGAPGGPVPYIKISANADGSYTVMNSRNRFAKKYAARK
jgi:hypothetical protein